MLENGVAENDGACFIVKRTKEGCEAIAITAEAAMQHGSEPIPVHEPDDGPGPWRKRYIWRRGGI